MPETNRWRIIEKKKKKGNRYAALPRITGALRHFILFYIRDRMAKFDIDRRVLQTFLLGDRDFTNNEDLILRDHLALVRTRLANERTLLSYIRSALYLLLGGIALLQLENYGDLYWVGNASLVMCVLFITIGFYRYHTLRRQLDRMYPNQISPKDPAEF